MSNETSLSYEPGVLRVLQTKDVTRQYYNKIAKVYDLLSEEAEQPMREAGLKKLAARPGEKILEVGFGTGHCLVEIARAVGPHGKVLGIDISDNMVSLAQELINREGLSERVHASARRRRTTSLRPRQPGRHLLQLYAGIVRYA